MKKYFLIEKIAGKLFNSSILDYIAFSESIKKEEVKFKFTLPLFIILGTLTYQLTAFSQSGCVSHILFCLYLYTIEQT